MSAEIFDNILTLSNDNEVAESGGGHNNKGVEFQKHWAILRMFDLHTANQEFLLLFESIQDIAILDSPLSPKSIWVYQVKKKDRNEWTWNGLTALTTPISEEDKKKTPKKVNVGATKKKASANSDNAPSIKIAGSPIGKLYRACCAIKGLEVNGAFVSNAGANIPLEDGGNIATTVSPNLSLVRNDHIALLNTALGISADNVDLLPLSRIFIEKVNIPVDDPSTYLVGVINKYLSRISPEHAAQAQSLLDAIMVQISPLGTKTHKCLSFDEVVKQRGYSKQQFSKALSDLEALPDVKFFWDDLIQQLRTEGTSFLDIMKLQIEFASYYKRQVESTKNNQEEALEQAVDSYLDTIEFNEPFIPTFNNAYDYFLTFFPELKRELCIVVLSIRAIKHART